MASKNDLSALKVQTASKLPNTLYGSYSTSKQVGRKAKPVNEKQTKMVGLRFTESEYKAIQNKAGLIPIATFLKDRIGIHELL